MLRVRQRHAPRHRAADERRGCRPLPRMAPPGRAVADHDDCARRRPDTDEMAPYRRGCCLLCRGQFRSEEHTPELQSLMRISYAVFCLKKKKIQTRNTAIQNSTIPRL